MLLYSLITLFFLSLAESALIIYATKKNNTEISYIQEQNPKLIKLDGIYAKINQYHTCHNDDNSTDSFFEFKLINNTKSDFTNWNITVPLVNNIKLKGSWNADVFLDGNTLHFSPDGEKTSLLKNNSYISFEIYINHEEQIQYDEIKIEGNLVKQLYKYPLHIINLIIALIIIVALIIYSIVYKYMKHEIDILNMVTKRSYAIIDQTMKTFVNFIDAKDEYTRGHSTRVAEYSKAIAKRMGYDEQFQQDIYYMGLMHDIGKITVPDSILNKTTHLTPDEWAVIQMHTENGARLLRNFTVIPEIRDAVLYHHERYDGKGYLAQLKGEEIPLVARIICVADSYDAMNTNRCYRLKYSRDRIIKEFERCSARQFDPTIASIMIELITDGTI